MCRFTDRPCLRGVTSASLFAAGQHGGSCVCAGVAHGHPLRHRQGHWEVLEPVSCREGGGGSPGGAVPGGVPRAVGEGGVLEAVSCSVGGWGLCVCGGGGGGCWNP
jgi:hypothetical protein